MHSWPQEEGDSYRRLGRALEKYVLGADWPWLWVSPGADLRHGPTSANERSQKSTCVSLNRKLPLDPSHSQQISRTNIKIQFLPNSNNFLSQYLSSLIKDTTCQILSEKLPTYRFILATSSGSINPGFVATENLCSRAYFHILGNIFWGDISKWLIFWRKI